MVSVTNNTKNFIECNDTPLVVYGAGVSGYWTGYYLKKCDIDFDCYIDKGIEREGALYGGKPVYHPHRMLEYSGGSLRVIIASAHYEVILADIMWLTRQHDLKILCLIPRYKVADQDLTDINQMLGYFRQYLIRTEIPTIFSTDCSAGVLYSWLGWEIASPTINTAIEHEDLVKLCTRPYHYLSLPLGKIEMSKLHRSTAFPPFGECHPQGIIDDIRVNFGHSNDAEKSKEFWNMMRTRVNLNRVIAVMTEYKGSVPLSVMREFAQLKIEKMFLYIRNPHGVDFPSIVKLPATVFLDRSTVLEDTFDLVGWINGDYKLKQ